MVTRGWRRASRGGRAAALAVVASVAVSVAGCGASNTQRNPRPAAQLEVSASVNPSKIQISPDKFGAGVVNFTVANLSSSPVTFSVSGGQQKASTVQIQPGAPDYLKMNLKEGTYQASVGSRKIKPATIKVGPERPSSQNQLLLP